MNTALSKYPYVLAILYGMLAFFIPATEPMPMFLAFSLFFILGGCVFGFFWPQQYWRWGLWIAGPFLVFMGLSVLFAGQLNADLLLLPLAVASGCLGSYITSWFKLRRKIIT